MLVSSTVQTKRPLQLARPLSRSTPPPRSVRSILDSRSLARSPARRTRVLDAVPPLTGLLTAPNRPMRTRTPTITRSRKGKGSNLVGCLPWIAGCTRPDISFAESFLARQVARPTEHLWQMALGVVAYLSNTRTVGLTLGGKWQGQEATRRLGRCGLGRLSRDPKIDHRLDNRAGRLTDRVVVEATGHIGIDDRSRIHCDQRGRQRDHVARELLETLGYRQPTTTLHCDNQGAIALTQKPSSHPRTKDIAIRHHQYASGSIWE
jgi:hypothetical protein